MASKMVGRADCPECGFKSAHVKQSEKCLYRYCPDCGSQHYAKSERQRSDLMAKTRLPEGSATGTGEATPGASATGSTTGPNAGCDAIPTPTETVATTPPAPAPKRRGLFF